MAARKETDIDAIKEDLASLKRSIESLTEEFNRAGDSAVEQATEQFSETLKRLRRQLNETVTDIADRGRKSAETVTTSVTERPMQSLVVAFAAGLIIAQFIKRR